MINGCEQGYTPASNALDVVVVVFSLMTLYELRARFATDSQTLSGGPSFLPGAISLSGVLFLILEMYTPFRALLQISGAPLCASLTYLGN